MDKVEYKLRDYQQEAVDAGVKFMKSNEKTGAIIVAPTASGKSIYISSIANRLNGKTLILQPTREILWQNYEKMCSYVGEENIGVYSASANRKDIGKITFATIGSIIKKKELFGDFNNLIIDEAHSVNAKGGQYEEIVRYFGGKVLGVTATAYRLHSYNNIKTGKRSVVAKFLNRTRPRIFSKIIHITQIQELYKRGYLCPVDYEINKDYNYKEIKLNSTGMDFEQLSLELYNEKKGIIKIVKDNIINNNLKHFLVFTSSVKEAKQLKEELVKENICSEIVSAETPKKEREDIIKYFKEGNIKVVTNVGTLTTGFDFPELDCVILARPTQSVALYTQIIGRGIRISPGKKSVKVIDICGNVERFGKIEEFEIVEDKKGLHRLKSNVGYLTGYDFVSNTDLEKTNYKNMVEGEFSRDVMPFGKYRNLHISRLPQKYLDWCLLTFESGSLKDKLIKEKERRDKKYDV